MLVLPCDWFCVSAKKNCFCMIALTGNIAIYSVCIMSTICALDSVYGRVGGQYDFRTPPTVQPIRLWNLHPREFRERVYRGSVQLRGSTWSFWKYSRHSWVSWFFPTNTLFHQAFAINPQVLFCDSFQKHTYIINVQVILLTCWVAKLVCHVQLHIISYIMYCCWK